MWRRSFQLVNSALRSGTAVRVSTLRPATRKWILGATGASAFATASVHALAEEKKAPEMPYRVLGNTGLAVSVLSFGFWATFGSKTGLNIDQAGLETAMACLREARNAGVNLFDNAETYGNPRGEAETIMGEAIKRLREEDPVKWRRSDIIISTKIFWGGEGVNEKGLSRKHIQEGADACLKRLQVDYVDLMFVHRPDPYTPTETVVRAMTELVRSGKATAWGTSEWSAQQITEAFWIARSEGLEPPQFEQPQYHMFERKRVESEYFPLYRQPYVQGLTIWSPLASGLLTGKYNDGVPEGSRIASPGMGWLQKNLQQWHKEGKIEKVRALGDYAKKNFGCTTGQLAVAWVIKNPNVSTILLGASAPGQLTETLGALEVAKKMTPEHMKALDDLLGSKPDAYGGYGSPSAYRAFPTI